MHYLYAVKLYVSSFKFITLKTEMKPPLTVSFVVLPQALKAVIPAIVGQFISLFQLTNVLCKPFHRPKFYMIIRNIFIYIYIFWGSET